jgi:hypothetical protein
MEKKKDQTAQDSAAPAVDIAAIVKAAIEAAQGNNTTLATAITEAVKSNQGIRKISVGERQAKGLGKNPFNPTNKKRELDGEYFQNFYPMPERQLHDNEIEMLAQLKQGRFGPAEFPITVVVKRDIDGHKKVYINYPDGRDARNLLKNYAPNFHQMLVKLVQESKDQLAQRKAEARALLADDTE